MSRSLVTVPMPATGALSYLASVTNRTRFLVQNPMIGVQGFQCSGVPAEDRGDAATNQPLPSLSFWHLNCAQVERFDSLRSATNMASQAWLEPDLVGLRKAVWCASARSSASAQIVGCSPAPGVGLGLSAQSQQLNRASELTFI